MPNKASSRAALVCERIARDLASRGEGDEAVLGTEREIMSQFGASRAAVREAIRTLEARGLIRVRRGRRGGTRLACDGSAAMASSLAAHFTLTRTPLLDLAEAQTVIGSLAVEFAAERIDREGIGAIRLAAQAASPDPASMEQFARERRPLLRAILDAADSSALSVLMEGVGAAIRGHIPVKALSMRNHEAQVTLIHRDDDRVVEAIVAQDVTQARTLYASARTHEYEILGANLREGYLLQSATLDGDGKLAVKIAYSLADEIRTAPEGAAIGRQQDLVARYDCSTAVLREALRLLEAHGVITVHRGHGGGVRVGDPDRSILLEEIGRTIGAGAARQDVAMLRAALEASAAVRAAKLGNILAPGDVTNQLGRASANRAFAVLLAILKGADRREQDGESEADRLLVEAIAGGDHGLARRYALARLSSGRQA